MLEIPESQTIATQINQTVRGKQIQQVIANASPHGFAMYFGAPENYGNLLTGKRIGAAKAVAGLLEIEVEHARLLFSDGVNIRYLPMGREIPLKHQLLLTLDDQSSVVCTVQMYGGLWAFHEGENDNPYYRVAQEKPSPLTIEFDEGYFDRLMDGVKQTLSVKAFLATEQRIPGLGNGVLQDILFNARINPRCSLNRLTGEDRSRLFHSVKDTLFKMTAEGGRDTEKDLFGHDGGYQTIMSSKKLNQPCPVCGGAIVRQAYMGGNVYFCPDCQPVK